MKQNIDLFINIAKFYAVLSKNLEGKLGMLGFNEFIVLYHLNKASNNKLRRIDLAEKLGLTASGITRMLLPMEKLGLIKKEANENDARVSYVCLAAGGKEQFDEALERFNVFLEDLIDDEKVEDVKKFNDFIGKIGGKISWN